MGWGAVAPLGIPHAVSQPCQSWGSPCSSLRLPPPILGDPQEGLHGAVPLRWPLLTGDTGTCHVCCRRFKTKCLWGSQRGWDPAARLCWLGEAMTCWASALPGQEMLGWVEMSPLCT